ncbi:hypothetical protein M3Y96_00761200 [Aphelenchoides besseyi]|nr:hypothetical protein M3Y96_00761200 [Aphelenchoides besseyi]
MNEEMSCHFANPIGNKEISTMSGCEHEALFTTGVFRVLVFEGRFRPHSEQSRRISRSCTLQWDQENAFFFRGSKPSLMHNDYKISLKVERPETDLEYSMWTEDENGKVLKGNKDIFAANPNITLDANLTTSFACARVRTVYCQVCADRHRRLEEYRMESNKNVEVTTTSEESNYLGKQPKNDTINLWEQDSNPETPFKDIDPPEW